MQTARRQRVWTRGLGLGLGLAALFVCTAAAQTPDFTQAPDATPNPAEPATAPAAPAKPTTPSIANEGKDLLDRAAAAVQGGDWSAAGDVGLRLLLLYGPRVIGFLLIVIVGYFVAKFLAALLGALSLLGISVASFAAVVAAAGFAIGLAFQGTLSNFAAGVLLLVFRPFTVGDVINAAGVTAKVNQIDLFTTTLDTFDYRRIIVPNSQIAGDTIENVTHHDVRRCDVEVGVSYTAPLDETRAALTAAAEALGDQIVQGEGRGTQVVLTGLGDSAVTWVVRAWVRSDDFWRAKEQLIGDVKRRLDDAGIGIPFPQMDVHLKQDAA